MARPRAAAAPAPSSLSWDLERCPAGQLAQRYVDLEAFVSWLGAQDIPAPACWYTHGWLVHRLAALQAWRARAYAPDAHPRDAADWWMVGVAALQRDWEPCLAHEGRHPPPDAPWDDPVPIPEFGAFVRALVRERAEHPPPAPRARPARTTPP
ncbi:MAG: hypothetical protein M0027_14100 [Candidatus Dormibacteraeota bacterium]|jgi:hypothetical protein|nr:hypothetical protein [Candidatus Dormibacteraeota bacterium]